MGNRNEQILKSIEHGKMPILPFELVLATNAMSTHANRQSELGKKLGEMMQQSSETWHDNAPAEAVANDAKILVKAAEANMKIIHDCEVFDYKNDDTKVSLGSLVEVQYEGSNETSSFILTGATRDISEEMIDGLTDIQDIECATIASPVGQALFDKNEGDTAEFTVNGRSICMKIIRVGELGIQV